MKKIRIFIVPHNPNEKQRIFSFNIFLIFFLIIIIAILSFFTFKNLTRYIDTSSIFNLENDNRSLKKYITRIENEIPVLKKQVDSLKTEQEKIMNNLKFSVGESKELKIEDVDSILMYLRIVDSNLISFYDEISKNKEFYPSIIPVQGNIVRRFGKAYDYLTEKWKIFNGIGIASKSGNKVVATAYGIVEKTGNNKEMGNYIVINHNNIYKTTYAHLGSIIVRQGQRVKRGDVIGTMGKTGKIPFPILYYEIKKGDKFLNPEDFILEGI
uniref:M23 family metallopeptidase n=1 Tax=candidate division WOR-3 bacterium TaxID=2052148 RepID=A0A7C4YSW8_UNCW3